MGIDDSIDDGIDMGIDDSIDDSIDMGIDDSSDNTEYSDLPAPPESELNYNPEFQLITDQTMM